MLDEILKQSTEAQIKSYNQLLDGKVDGHLNNIDEYMVAPMFGYKDKKDYRDQCSVDGQLHKLKMPCMYLHAWDDFVIGPDCIPADEFEKCDNLILATTKVGAHCCHFEAGRFGGLLPTQWF